MSEILNQMLALANEDAEASGIDMNEAVKGGGGARLLPAGYAFAQLVEYVEMGNHPQEFKGQKKDPAKVVQLGFALTGCAPDPADPTKTIAYNNDDGTPYIMRPWPFAISQNEKARAFLLFKALNWKGTAKSFGQLLTQKWLVKIVHEEKSATDKKIVSRMDLKSFLPPVEAVSRQPYQIADADPALYRLFLWDRPTMEGWNSLKIEGTYEAEENGQKVQKSKNRIQEEILGALNFEGSPLQQLLGGGGLALPSAVAAPAAVTAPSVAPTPTPVVQAAPEASAVAPSVPFDPTPPGQPQQVTAPVAAVGVVAPVPMAVPAAIPAIAVTIPASPALPT